MDRSLIAYSHIARYPHRFTVRPEPRPQVQGPPHPVSTTQPLHLRPALLLPRVQGQRRRDETIGRADGSFVGVQALRFGMVAVGFVSYVQNRPVASFAALTFGHGSVPGAPTSLRARWHGPMLPLRSGNSIGPCTAVTIETHPESPAFSGSVTVRLSQQVCRQNGRLLAP